MKTALLFLCVVAAIAQANAGALRVRRQLVPREFQNINIENYLKNERAVAFQLKCIVYDGPCDRIGKYLKITIPELLTNQCRNCDPEQRMRAGRLVAHIQQNFPKEWEDAVKKFQGGQVKPEDAQKLETLLGVKLDPKLVGANAEGATNTEASSTAAPAAAAPATEKAETPAPAPAPAASSTAAEVATSTTTTTVAPSSTAAPVIASSTVAAAAASEPKSEAVEAAAADAVPAAVAAPTTAEAPASPSTVAAPSTTVATPSSSETPAPVSSEAPKVTEAPSTAAPATTAA